MKNEFLLVDKSAGVSSFGAVARVRRRLTEQMRQEEAAHSGSGQQRPKRVKVGHTGTLDPFATGLLILLVGKGTKRAGEFLKLDKEYIATLRLGAVSTTGDPEGEITELWQEREGKLWRNRGDMLKTELKSEQEVREKPNKEAVENLVQNWPVENWQKVPAFSAVKINGQRAYKLARAGKAVEMPVRKVKIYKLEVLKYEYPELVVRAKVSSGTYIRALAEEIGEKLGVGAYLTALRRTKIADYCVEDATKIPLD